MAPNHGYTPAAYISDDLASAVTGILATNPNGIPLSQFLLLYKVQPPTCTCRHLPPSLPPSLTLSFSLFPSPSLLLSLSLSLPLPLPPQESTQSELKVNELGFDSLVQLLGRVPGVTVMKPPEASFLMVYSTKHKRGKKSGNNSSELSEGEEVSVCVGGLSS